MKRFALLALLAACTAADDAAHDTADAAAGAVTRVDCAGATIAATVTTAGFSYAPSQVTIAVGEVVELHPSASHDAVADDGAFHVGFGEDVCLRFEEAASHTFRCTPHQFTGTIVVE